MPINLEHFRSVILTELDAKFGQPSTPAGVTARQQAADALAKAIGTEVNEYIDGGGGGTAPQPVNNITPTGVIDGVNRDFTLPSAPSPGSSLLLYRNGALQRQDVEYTLMGSTITYAVGYAPTSGEWHVAFYQI